MDLLPGRASAPDLYPLGSSLGEWATALLKRVEGDNLILVGCSVGGSCAIEIAAMAPDRVSAMVLIGTKAGHRPDPELRTAACRMLRVEGMRGAWETYWAPLFSSQNSTETLAAARRAALAQSPALVAKGVEAFHTRRDRAEFLSRFKKPLIVVTGEEDSAPGPETSVRQAASAPFGQLRAIPGCGHYVPLEAPEELNGVIRELIPSL